MALNTNAGSRTVEEEDRQRRHAQVSPPKDKRDNASDQNEQRHRRDEEFRRAESCCNEGGEQASWKRDATEVGKSLGARRRQCFSKHYNPSR